MQEPSGNLVRHSESQKSFARNTGFVCAHRIKLEKLRAHVVEDCSANPRDDTQMISCILRVSDDSGAVPGTKKTKSNTFAALMTNLKEKERIGVCQNIAKALSREAGGNYNAYLLPHTPANDDFVREHFSALTHTNSDAEMGRMLRAPPGDDDANTCYCIAKLVMDHDDSYLNVFNKKA